MYPRGHGYVYMLTNRHSGVLYIGSTNDLVRRMRQHRDKVYPKSFTKRYNVCHLVYVEVYENLWSARSREYRLKKWKRQWKIELIEYFNPRWYDLNEFEYV